MSIDHEPFRAAYHNDVTVQQMTDAGATLEDIIVALVKQKHEFTEECLRYQLLAPPIIPKQSA